MQFESGILKCFVNGILQGTFKIKNGVIIERNRKKVLCSGYSETDYNLVNDLFSNSEEQIWTLTVGKDFMKRVDL